MLGLRLPSALAKGGVASLTRSRSAARRQSISLNTPPPEPAVAADETPPADHDEFKLPDLPSLIIVIGSSLLLQVTYYIIVSSSNEYAQHLGGTETFSGLVIGVTAAVAALTLPPIMRLDQGLYSRPLHFCCACQVLGNALYGLAYRANWLYLILIGRMVIGAGFTLFMYAKRYCSDPRLVGIRRRTTLAGWQVLGAGIGFSLGPFAGGLLSKIGFANTVFNGFTSPAWIMAGTWLLFWIAAAVWFEDAPPFSTPPSAVRLQELNGDGEAAAVEQPPPLSNTFKMSPAQWGVVATMCWFAMMCFFILAGWESNIPVFTASNAPQNPFHFSPFQSGNLIALGGACTIPFLLLNLAITRRVQDRYILAVGTAIGLVGLFVFTGILAARKVNYASLFMAWFFTALGFNVATTVTLSLLSKQLPGEWNGRISLFIQWSNYTGRVTGSVWGGAGIQVGMLSFMGLQVALAGIGGIMFLTLWKNLKAKTG